ncbi:MAG: hypothetical protein IT204_18890 [Fimbriimonadaceae bacterium]|nr:hypothetical protein [Fimbriimonadaceae bacterium]
MPRALLCSLLLTAAVTAQEVLLPLPNPGFENGLEGWRPAGSVALVSDPVASGQAALKLVDPGANASADATAAAVPVKPATSYLCRAKVYPISGTGLGFYVRRLSAARQLIGKGDEFHRGLPDAPAGQWSTAELAVFTTADTAFLEIWLHSYSHATVTAVVDDLAIVDVGQTPPRPPLWTPSYKLRPNETGRLTAADVVGPDGLVYPNWSFAGVPGGIPTVAAKLDLASLGARPDDELDDSAALQRAIDQVGAGGGGAVTIGPGVWQLDQPLAIRHNGVVLRGAGRERTHLRFRYNLGPDGIKLPQPSGEVLYNNSPLALHATPRDLKKLELWVGDKSVRKVEWQPHWGNTFSLNASGSDAIKALPPEANSVTVRGVATYGDGRTREVSRTFRVDRTGSDPADLRPGSWNNAISISGDGRWWKAQRLELAADGRRGDTSLQLKATTGLAAGDWAVLEGPATPRWKELTQNKCPHGNYRLNIVPIRAVAGDRVTLGEPLRIEFPVVDGARLWKIDAITGCGLEDFSITQTEDLWINTAMFTYAVGCWAQRVTVNKCGRFPLYGAYAERCTIRDCLFDDAWFKGGGGTAYAGWENSFDCLLTDCETRKLRHAPCVQWAASGNVIRRSTFVDSDAQWHSGWTNENLFEQCVVVANPGNGAYGYGAWASPPEDAAHGPNGPRNVVYNCDLRSARTGLWMGGMNEGWMILHNRFRVKSGQGIFAKTYSFDHQVRGNVFVLEDATQPAVLLQTPDCGGLELVDNRVYGGNGTLLLGASKPALEQGNQVLPLNLEAPRPQPAVPSIYEWQVANVRGAR